MNKRAFLQQLEQELASVSPDERVAAMQYYNEYFDDAGPENEENVIQELGSPQKIANDIKATSADEGWTPPEKSPSGPAANSTATENFPPNNSQQPPYRGSAYTSAGQQQKNPYNQQNPPPYPQPPSQNKSLKIALAVLIALFCLPVFGGLLASVFGVIFSLFAAAAIVLFIPFIVGFAFTISGVGVFFASFALLPYTIANSLFTMGLGLFFVAAGLALFVLGIWVFGKVVVPLFHACVSLAKTLLTSFSGFVKKIFS